jgi:hypothetical protein
MQKQHQFHHNYQHVNQTASPSLSSKEAVAVTTILSNMQWCSIKISGLEESPPEPDML